MFNWIRRIIEWIKNLFRKKEVKEEKKDNIFDDINIIKFKLSILMSILIVLLILFIITTIGNLVIFNRIADLLEGFRG